MSDAEEAKLDTLAKALADRPSLNIDISGFVDMDADRQGLVDKEFKKLLLAKKHALAIFCLRPWAMKAFGNAYDTAVKGFHPLNPNVFLRATSVEELSGSDDLRKFAEWVADRGRNDYMECWPTDGLAEAGSRAGPERTNNRVSQPVGMDVCPLCGGEAWIGVRDIATGPIVDYWRAMGYRLQDDFGPLPGRAPRRH